MGAREGSWSRWCRDNGTHTGTPTRLGLHPCAHAHRSHTPPRTPRPHVVHIPTSLLQLHTSAHTHYMRSHTQSSSTPMYRWARADAQAGYMHLGVHTSLHTRVVGHTCTHTCFPPYTGKWTCASAHTQAAYNSMQMPLSPKCAGTKVKERCKAHWAPHEWVGWGSGLPPSAPSWMDTSPTSSSPYKGTFNSGQ